MARASSIVRDETLRVGPADVSPTAPAHVPRVKEGNELGNYDRQAGHLSDGRSTARRSTGINPQARDAIDPRMPNLSPA
jgi:hypothetical protein